MCLPRKFWTWTSHLTMTRFRDCIASRRSHKIQNSNDEWQVHFFIQRTTNGRIQYNAAIICNKKFKNMSTQNPSTARIGIAAGSYKYVCKARDLQHLTSLLRGRRRLGPQPARPWPGMLKPERGGPPSFPQRGGHPSNVLTVRRLHLVARHLRVSDGRALLPLRLDHLVA